ncbi:MAG: hypothetical protein QM715_16435 [Nibricoccus sp.]
MKPRPTSVSIIAWILIVIGGLSFITSTLTINNPMVRDLMSKSPIPVPIQFVMMYVGLGVSILSGVFMLKAKAWARMLYIGWSLIGFTISFSTSPMKAAIIPGFIVFLIIAFFLFRPKANEFFSQAISQNDRPSF